MKLDFLNISIIKEFYNLKEKEKIELAKMRDRIFPNLSKTDKNKKLGLIRDRLQSMPRELFKIEHKKNSWNYELESDNIEIREFNFPEGKKEGIALKLEGRWRIIEL